MTRKSVLAVIVIFFVCLALMAWPMTSSPVVGAPVAQPSPRPTLTPPGGAPPEPRDTGGEDGVGPEGAIVGTVTDLSTGQPGRGIDVLVNEATVTTDSEGHYSITGLGAGEYTVSLVLPGEWMSAQVPVTIRLDGQNTVVVNLAYYSQPPTVIPAPSPTATPTPPPPVELPQTGGP